MAQITLNSSGVASNGSLLLQSNGTTTAVTIDTAQNMGLGVTPSAWTGTGAKAIQVGTYASLTSGTSTGYTDVGHNIYENYSYLQTNFASFYRQISGQHQWFTAPSGTAGNAITFTQPMTLDASGRLGIGISSPSQKLHVDNSANSSTWINVSNGSNGVGAAAGILIGTDQGAAAGALSQNSSGNTLPAANALRLRNLLSAPITFETDGSERARIESGGAVVIARTSNLGYSEKLTVAGDIATNGTQFNMVPGADFEFVQRSAFAMKFFVNSATVVANLSITGVWTDASDARYKENITDSPYGLAAVMALKPRAYNLINLTDKPQIGFIAQEVLEVVPEVVESVHNSVTDEDRYTLSYGNMVAVLTKAIQEQQAIIISLTDRITALEQA